MKFPAHKTKIVATLGPASRREPVLAALIAGGVAVVRLNFSHGTPRQHAADIALVRRTARRLGRPVAILADLPGPKIRLGRLAHEPLALARGDEVVLTTEQRTAGPGRIPVEYRQLPRSVRIGGLIYINDGFVQLRVLAVRGRDVRCRVLVGGQLLSRKGLNLPGARIYARAVTARDLALLDFGLDQGIGIFGLSFVQGAADISAVRRHAAARGREVRIVAKIERPEAVANLDAILQAADGVMVARGDLGVELPIEQVPLVQKRIIRSANLAGRPVITATQMLESMTEHVRPTRAEASDVANAILDGSDAVMLSEETAIGRYPARAVAMMAAIARRTEAGRDAPQPDSGVEHHYRGQCGSSALTVEDAVSLSAVDALRALRIRWVLTPTHGGSTPRRLARFRPAAWILAFTRFPAVAEFLALSHGVVPIHVAGRAADWPREMLRYLQRHRLARRGERVLVTEGLQSGSRGCTDSIRIMTVR